MRRFVLTRVFQSFLVLFLFLTAVFFLAQIIMPGDFAILIEFGEGVEKVNELRQELGLDEPIWQRYIIWIGNILKGDLGRSFYRTQDFRNPGSRIIRLPVTAIIGRGLLLSVMVFGLGTLVAFHLGAWLGKNIAWRKPQALIGVATFVGIVLYTAFPPLLAWAAKQINRKVGLFREIITRDAWIEHFLEGPLWRPSTFAGLMLATLVLVAAVLAIINHVVDRRYRLRLGILAYTVLLVTIWVSGWFAIGAGDRFMDIVHFLGLGIVVFVLLAFGETMLMMRTSMVDMKYEEYIFAARAKGLPEKVVRDKHAARNALLPVLSRLIVNIPIILAGLVIIEQAIGTGGMGSILFDSLRSQDVPVMMGSLVIIGIIALVSRLGLEITIAYLDPRIRIGQKAQGTSRTTAEFRGEGFFHAPISRISSWLKPRNQQTMKAAETTPAARIDLQLDNLTLHWRRLQLQAHASWKRTKENWRVFSENKLAVMGLILIVIFILMAVLRPLLMKTVWSKGVYDPIIGFDPLVFPHPTFPSLRHLLGTDALGRDILSMLLAASTSTLAVALTSAVTAAVIGTLIGAFSGYYQGAALDTFFRYLSDMLLIMPAPIIMVIIGARFHERLNAFEFGMLYGLIAGGSYVAIVMRSQALTIMAKPFIAASWVAGAGGRRIIFTHLIPHMLPLASVQMMLTVVGAVIAYGFIAFVGVTRSELNWGSMIYQAFIFSMNMLGKTPWLQLISPAIALSLFAASFYFISRGLHEVAEPRLRKR